MCHHRILLLCRDADLPYLHHLPRPVACAACTTFERRLYKHHRRHQWCWSCITRWSRFMNEGSNNDDDGEIPGYLIILFCALWGIIFFGMLVDNVVQWNDVTPISCYTTYVNVTMTSCASNNNGSYSDCLQAYHHIEWLWPSDATSSNSIVMGYDVNDSTCTHNVSMSSLLSCSYNSTQLLAESVKWLGVHETCYVSTSDGTWRDPSKAQRASPMASYFNYQIFATVIIAILIMSIATMMTLLADAMVIDWQRTMVAIRDQHWYQIAHRWHSPLYHDLWMLRWCSSRSSLFQQLHDHQPLLIHHNESLPILVRPRLRSHSHHHEPLLRQIASYLVPSGTSSSYHLYYHHHLFI